LWNQWPPKCCFGDPNNRVESWEVPSEIVVQSCSVMLKDHTSWLVVWATAGMLGRVITPQRGKWKLLFINGCTCKSTVYRPMEFLSSCEDRTNARVCLGIILKKLWYFSDINELLYCCNDIFHFYDPVCITYWISLIVCSKIHLKKHYKFWQSAVQLGIIK
jgi:hypothetical protein